jgi:hypothetical protein
LLAVKLALLAGFGRKGLLLFRANRETSKTIGCFVKHLACFACFCFAKERKSKMGETSKTTPLASRNDEIRFVSFRETFDEMRFRL